MECAGPRTQLAKEIEKNTTQNQKNTLKYRRSQRSNTIRPRISLGRRSGNIHDRKASRANSPHKRRNARKTIQKNLETRRNTILWKKPEKLRESKNLGETIQQYTKKYKNTPHKTFPDKANP